MSNEKMKKLKKAVELFNFFIDEHDLKEEFLNFMNREAEGERKGKHEIIELLIDDAIETNGYFYEGLFLTNDGGLEEKYEVRDPFQDIALGEFERYETAKLFMKRFLRRQDINIIDRSYGEEVTHPYIDEQDLLNEADN